MAFVDLERDFDLTRHAICKNWRMDHRVSGERESDMLASGYFRNGLNGEDWWESKKRYFERELCLPSHTKTSGDKSAYLRKTNSANIICERQVPPFDQLVHAASLNRILERLSERQEYTLSFDADRFWQITEYDVGQARKEEFNSFMDDLVNTLEQKGPSTIQEVAGLICDGLGDRQPPWWACFADEIDDLIAASDWTGLCKALGMGHMERGEWLIVWRYEIGVAGHIYRPTVVEANDGPFHYPSPPDYPYGVIMPLDGSLPTCREVLHPPLRGADAIDSCIGVLGRIDSPIADYGKINSLRYKHKQRLLREFATSNTRAWLRRHT
jgi:hypothetical protein